MYILFSDVDVWSHVNNYRAHNMIHDYYTTYNIQLVTPCYRTTTAIKGSHFRAIKIYNKLPDTIRKSRTIKTLKTQLKNYLLPKIHYLIEEYLQ